MSLLTAADLAHMRAMQAEAFPDLCSISRPTATTTPTGGQSKTWTTVARNVRFRLSAPFMSMRAAEGVTGERVSQVSTFIATFAREEDVRPSDQIVFGERVFEVTGYATGSWETAKRVTCVEIT